jgi:hypothetical protein
MAAALESAMREYDKRLAALQYRALSRLVEAGYSFTSIRQAQARYLLQKANPGSPQYELDWIQDHQQRKAQK